MDFAELIEYRIIEPFRKSLKPDEIANSLEEFNPKKHKLLQNIKKVIKFKDRYDITNLGVLEIISNSNSVTFSDSNVEDLGNLRIIGRSAMFTKSKIKDLGNLKYIGIDAFFINSNIVDLGNLTSVGGDISLGNQSLGKLTNLMGSLTGDMSRKSELREHLNKMNEVFFLEKKLYFPKESSNGLFELVNFRNLTTTDIKSYSFDYQKNYTSYESGEESLYLGKIKLNRNGTFNKVYEWYKKYLF